MTVLLNKYDFKYSQNVGLEKTCIEREGPFGKFGILISTSASALVLVSTFKYEHCLSHNINHL